jgi:putative Mn2+ efflux pump MntP
MIEVLQWSTLAICGLATLVRVPSALRGENRSLFSILALMTLAILLSIDAPYVAVDQALGGMNVANLVLRFVIFAAVFFLGFRMARGFGADDSLRLITGPVGIAAAAAASAAVVVLFLMTDTAGSSAGLIDVAAKGARNAALVEYYGAAGRLYPAFIMLALFPAMVRTLRSSLSVLVRCGATLLALGTVAISLSLLFPVIPPSLGFLRFVINYTAVLCVVLGLVLFWLAKALAHRATKKHTSPTGAPAR